MYLILQLIFFLNFPAIRPLPHHSTKTAVTKITSDINIFKITNNFSTSRYLTRQQHWTQFITPSFLIPCPHLDPRIFLLYYCLPLASYVGVSTCLQLFNVTLSQDSLSLWSDSHSPAWSSHPVSRVNWISHRQLEPNSLWNQKLARFSPQACHSHYNLLYVNRCVKFILLVAQTTYKGVIP